MYNSNVNLNDNISIDDYIYKRETKEFPINLEYYKVHNNVALNKEKPYGIGIIKTYEDNNEVHMEKSEFNHIFSKEKEADNMLKILVKNKVTPISLRDILEDYVLV